ncbi:hypothetical protein MMC06_004396 [Schaereria dolodes]|nr:hypothetical protein [Schaereria dolodes]
MASEELQLTYGVELEMILVFHEELLVNYVRALELDEFEEDTLPRLLTEQDLHDEALKRLVQDLPERWRREMSQATEHYRRSRPLYMGWAIKEERDPRTHTNPAVVYGPSFRTYDDEPLHLAREVLRLAPRTDNYEYWVETGVEDTFPIDIYQDAHGVPKRISYQNWHLANDRSLVGVDKTTIQAYLDQKKASSEHYRNNERNYALASRYNDAENWDSHGIELVSRVLNPGPDSINEIALLLETIKGRPPHRHGALVTDFCGLHIHIGVPVQPALGIQTEDFPLGTLQHLALILIVYEAQINTLFPIHRRMPSAAEQARMPAGHKPLAAYDILSNVIPPVWHDRQVSISAICDEIFRANMTVSDLSHLMMGGTKGHIVNWDYIRRQHWGKEPRTLEFRQHEGILSVEAVNWWAQFCMSLVRLAHARSLGPVPGLELREWSDSFNVFDLFDAMGFPAEGREHFRRRAAFFATDAF